MTDQDLMPWGKFKGEPMEKVPAGYLLWLWDEYGLWKREGLDCPIYQRGVRSYIVQNFHVLETECPDIIINHRP